MAKAPQLAHSKKLEIARYKKKFPTASIVEISLHYNVTYDQARRAIMQDQAGELRRTKPRAKKADVEKIIEVHDMDSLLEKQFHFALAQLERDATIAVDERVSLLDKLFSSRKILQQVRLESHIKRADSVIIAQIVRRFEPDASDERIIAIYKEELEKWKISQK
jgi:hypothetical protein